MPRVAKIPAFFIATKQKEKPAVVHFYTKSGKFVDRSDIRRVKTKEGIRFYAKPAKKR